MSARLKFCNFTIKQIQYELQTQGAEITLPADQFKRYTSKIVDLYVLYRLCCAMGLGAYVDEIMSQEIENKFQPPADRAPKERT